MSTYSTNETVYLQLRQEGIQAQYQFTGQPSLHIHGKYICIRKEIKCTYDKIYSQHGQCLVVESKIQRRNCLGKTLRDDTDD